MVKMLIKNEMRDFFEVLSTMPHMQPNAVREPPAEGWPGVDADALRAQGKTDEAIEFVRHLPCLAHESGMRHVNMTPYCTSVSFCDGEVCPVLAEDLLPTPGHVIWLATACTRAGHYLLLDTINGSITEYAPLGGTCLLSKSEYEALPSDTRWMAHETLPAQAWFSRERLRLENLIYMPVPSTLDGGDDSSTKEKAEYYFRATTRAQEDELLGGDYAIDDDESYVDDGDEETDSEDEMEDSDSDDGGHVIPMEEVKGVWGERKSFQPVKTTGHDDDTLVEVLQASKGITELNFEPTPSPSSEVVAARTARVYDIYMRNGWPGESFDREKCKDELAQFASEVRAAGEADQAMSG